MLEEIIKRTRSSLIITGHSGAGKTTLANLLSRYTGASVIEVGYHVVNEAAQQPRKVSALEYADAKLRAGKNYHFVEQIAANFDFTEPVIIVGPRQVQELRFFRDILDSSIIIGLDASPQVRKIRRCDPAEVQTEAPTWLQHRDEVERSWGAENTLRIADVMLDATKTPSHLLIQVARVWEDLGKPVIPKSTSYSFFASISNCWRKDNYRQLDLINTSRLIIEAPK